MMGDQLREAEADSSCARQNEQSLCGQLTERLANVNERVSRPETHRRVIGKDVACL